MNVIDMHCDTIARLYHTSAALRENPYHLDLIKLQKSQYLLQNFALFVNQRECTDPLETALNMAALYYLELEKNKDLIAPVFSYKDIEKNQKAGKISAMLTLEEGAVLRGQLSHLRNFYRLGVRMIALTWNYNNEIGAPNLQFSPERQPLLSARSMVGLTEQGIQIIQEMERLGMIIDVSHLSDGGFWDVVKHTTKPFVASHSNAASLCNVCRNLTDDMIRALGTQGGVMGLNFCTDFLREPTEETRSSMGGILSSNYIPVSKISDMVRHVQYIANVGGIEVCALGSDFDGIQNHLEFGDASGIGQLADALKKAGFTASEVDKIFYQNVLRVYKEVLV